MEARKVVVITCIALACLLLNVQGIVAAEDGWHFEITPYLWLPNIDGTVTFDGPADGVGKLETTAGPNDYLQHLKMAGMVSAGVRKDRWSVFTDVIYLDFSKEDSTVRSVEFDALNSRVKIGAGLDSGSRTSLEGTEWTLAGGYSLVQSGQGTLDVFGGFRYFTVKASLDWELAASVSSPAGGRTLERSGSISQRGELWDGIVGARGRINLGKSNLFIPYYLDIGTGTSALTWQALLGVAYAFNWWDIKLAYRHLYYNTDGKLIDDMRFSGPALGANFRF